VHDNMVGTVPTVRAKRTPIMEAAVVEFQEHGFASASMDAISARAEVSKRTLYKYFESKENLFNAIVESLSDRMSHTLDVQYDPALEIRAQLVKLAWAEGRLLMSSDVMAMARMIIGETVRNPQMAAKAQEDIDKKSVVVALLRAASDDGQLDVPAPQVAADEMIGLLKARAFWPVIFGAPLVTEAQMEAIVEDTVDMIMARYAKR
jgi:TetR/AcrR family transcriptional regulator of autoinduction and epiphytic fitness